MKISAKTVQAEATLLNNAGRERVRLAFLYWLDKVISGYETGAVLGDDDVNEQHLDSLRETRVEIESAANVSEMLAILTGENAITLYDLEAEDFFPILLVIAGEAENA